MCFISCDGSCQQSVGVSAIPGPGDVLVAALKGTVWVAVKVGVPVARVAVVQSVRFVAGKPVLPRARRNRLASGATWLRSGAKVARARTRLHWYAWPGWQRSLSRVALLAVLLAAWVAPLVTAIATALVVLVASGSAATAVVRRRSAAIGPRRVRAIVGDTDQPAISTHSTTKASALFSTLSRKVRVR
jgi:hypothetical protein